MTNEQWAMRQAAYTMRVVEARNLDRRVRAVGRMAIFTGACVGFALAACGCSAEAPSAAIGEREQSILSDDQFGVTSIDYFPCTPGNVTCYYPPGYGDGSPSFWDGVSQQWRVCFDSATFYGPSQATRAWNTLNYVLDEFEWNGAWTTFVNCAWGSPNLRVRAQEFANVGNFGTNDIRRYAQPICNTSQQMGEAPSILGVHRYCTNWTINIAMDRIDARFNINDDANLWLVDHAFGFGLAVPIVGAGVHAEDNTVWTWWSVFPLEKYGLRPREYCRARARYDNGGGANYNFITKQDNNCD